MIRQSRTNRCGNIRPLVHREYGCPYLRLRYWSILKALDIRNSHMQLSKDIAWFLPIDGIMLKLIRSRLTQHRDMWCLLHRSSHKPTILPDEASENSCWPKNITVLLWKIAFLFRLGCFKNQMFIQGSFGINITSYVEVDHQNPKLGSFQNSGSAEELYRTSCI